MESLRIPKSSAKAREVRPGEHLQKGKTTPAMVAANKAIMCDSNQFLNRPVARHCVLCQKAAKLVTDPHLLNASPNDIAEGGGESERT